MVWRSALLSSASREVAAMRRRRTGRISMRIADCAWACAYCNSLSNSSMDSDCTGWNLSPRAYSWRLWSNWRATGRVSRLVERSKDGEQAALADGRFEDGAELVVAVEVVDQLHDGAEGGGRVVEDEGVRRLGELPPLPLAVH